MSNHTKSGWTNEPTWNINLRYEEIFQSMAEEQEFDDVTHMADAFESLVNELEFQDLKVNTLAYEAVGAYLNDVNWEELAEHFYVEEEEEDEEVERLNNCNLIVEPTWCFDNSTLSLR